MHGFIAYGFYDQGRLLCSIEVPESDEHDATFDLKSELNPVCTADHSLIEVCRESTGANALNRIYGM